MNKKIAIIGGCTVDITSTFSNPVKMNDSNPGSIQIHIGGVASNIAQSLSQLGFKVDFYSAISNDVYGKEIQEKFKRLKIDISHCLFTSDYPQSIYLCMNDVNGEMVIGSSDMNILNLIDIPYLEQQMNAINEADFVFFDTNLDIQTMEYLFSHITKPIFMDVISTTKCLKLKEVLNQNKQVNLFCVKLNKIEAEAIYGYEIKDEDDLNNLAQKLTRKGIGNVCITLGKEGVFFATKVGPFFQAIQMDCPKDTKIVNTTGAGDAFLAGIIYGYSEDEDNECIINYGLAASQITLASEKPVSEYLDEEHLEKAFIKISK